MQRKGEHVGRPFVVGMASFFISQILLRLPIMYFVLEGTTWYHILKIQTVWFSLFTGFTAGLFEEVARYVGIGVFLKKNRRAIDGLAFGFGHGGIEAMLLVGLPVCITIVSGLGEVTVGAIGLSALERVAAIGIHIGETMIILNGFQKSQPILGLVIAIIIHTGVDFMIGFLPYQFNITGIWLELVFVIIACVLIGYTLVYFNHNKTIENKCI